MKIFLTCTSTFLFLAILATLIALKLDRLRFSPPPSLHSLVETSGRFLNNTPARGKRTKDISYLISHLLHKCCKMRVKTSLYTCWGYLHGRHRGWQIDFLRRIAYGRLSEILGPSKLRQDVLFRILDFSSQAQRIWQGLSPSYQRLLSSYTAGLNQGLIHNLTLKSPPSLFTQLHYHPEVWHETDTLALVLLQSFIQTRRTFTHDLEEESYKITLQKEGLSSDDISKTLKRLYPLWGDTEAPWHTNILQGLSNAHTQASNTKRSQKSRLLPNNY